MHLQPVREFRMIWLFRYGLAVLTPNENRAYASLHSNNNESNSILNSKLD